jgi:hypothetical protein
MLDLLLLGSYLIENLYPIPDLRGTDHITISVWEDCVKHAKSLQDFFKELLSDDIFQQYSRIII